MNAEVMFWFLLALGAVELLAIYLTGRAIKSLVTSELFKQKLIRRDQLKAEQDTEKSSDGSLKALTMLAAVFLPALLFGQEVAVEAVQAREGGDPFSPWLKIEEADLYIIGTVNLFLLGVLWYMKNVFQKLLKIDQVQEAAQAEVQETAGAKIMHILTDAVALEEEDSLDMGHDYDGIRELDNNLPPWWKWGFVATILYAVIHLAVYHFFEADDLQIAEYEKSVVEAEIEVAAWKARQAANVDEYTVVAMTGQSELKEGGKIFKKYCVQCHGEFGEGKVGPNLCDDYWLYGNDIKSIFSTVKYGAKRGMKSWESDLSAIEMQQVSSYLQTFQGTEPPVQTKDPEGDFYPVPTGEEEVSPEGEPDIDVDQVQTLEAGV